MTQEEVFNGRKDASAGPKRIKDLEQTTVDNANSAVIANSAAVQAQTTADAASAAANFAQTTANGKNTVTYSTSYPGSAANVAGDIWFVKSDASSSATIIAQYEGQGGTTWVARQLDNAVIANLDAGKITAGSAFTNTLSVATTLTLGTASLNGSIQSYGYPSASTYFYADKANVQVKGGTIQGSSIVGSSFQSTSGQLTISDSGVIRVYKTGSTSVLAFYVDPSTSATYNLYSDGAASLASLNIAGGGVNVYGGVTLNTGNLNMGLNNITNIGAISGGPTLNGGTTINAGLTVATGSTILSTLADGAADNVDAGAKYVRANNNGKLTASTTAPSSRRIKNTIKPLAREDWRRILAVEPVTYFYNEDPEHLRVGVIAEQVDEAGCGEFVGREDRSEPGRATGFDYMGFTAGLLLVCQEQQRLIDDLTARLARLEAA